MHCIVSKHIFDTQNTMDKYKLEHLLTRRKKYVKCTLIYLFKFVKWDQYNKTIRYSNLFFSRFY
jgi:hypothetical protein